MWHGKKNPFEVLLFLWDVSLINFYFFYLFNFLNVSFCNGMFWWNCKFQNTLQSPGEGVRYDECGDECRSGPSPYWWVGLFLPGAGPYISPCWSSESFSLSLSACWGPSERLLSTRDCVISEICVITELLIQAIDKLIKQYWAQCGILGGFKQASSLTLCHWPQPSGICSSATSHCPE